MSDFSQNGIISTLHDFGTKSVGDIEKELKKSGIYIVREKFLKKHQNKIEKFFEDEIQTILTPITVDSTHPLPFIPNLCLSLIAKIKHKKTKKAFISVVRISDLKQRFSDNLIVIGAGGSEGANFMIRKFAICKIEI